MKNAVSFSKLRELQIILIASKGFLKGDENEDLIRE